MPLMKGKLMPEDDYKVTKNFAYIKDNFDPSDGTTDHMISLMVFDLDDRDYVVNGGETTARGRAERFLITLQRSGKDAYKPFLKALNDSGYEELATRVDSTEVPPDSKRDPLAWIDDLPEETKNQRPSQADCSRLSAAFGKGWEHVFLGLGLTQVKIGQVSMDSHTSSVAISTLLIHWGQKNASRATFIALLTVLRKTEHCEIDWQKVEEIVKGLRV